MGPVNAKIILEWSDGRRAEVGTLTMESDVKGTELTARMRYSMKRVGWEIVRLGLKVMFPKRKWVTKYGE